MALVFTAALVCPRVSWLRGNRTLFFSWPVRWRPESVCEAKAECTVLHVTRMSELVETLRQLVAIDSTSTKSNIPMIEFLESRLMPLGFVCTRLNYDDGGIPKANLIATFGEGIPEVALVGHTDCVPFDENWKEALILTEKDAKLFGRGSCDTKAFIACALHAASATHKNLKKPMALIFTADEELGCVGAKKLVQAGLGKSKRAVIGEPTSLRPIRANKGYCLAEIDIHGKEGHSAYPDTGRNANFAAARFLTKLETYSKTKLRIEKRTDFEPPFATLNVGMLQGGKAKNVIAGNCRITLEWRPLPNQNTQEVLRDVEALIAECKIDEPQFEATVRPLRTDIGFDTALDIDVVQFLAKVTGKKPDTVAFGTEGPQMTALGAHSVVFGPGDITVAHQTGEYVPVGELHRAQEVLQLVLLEFAG
jgi:acetylornithine deacetylase